MKKKPIHPALQKRPAGRPSTWLSKIDAPPVALALYEMIGAMQHTDAFRTCHVYSGAKDTKGTPMFKFEGRVHSMPYVISSYMGIEYGKRNCNTPGCVNPFHYAPPTERIGTEVLPHFNDFTPPPAVGEDWADLIDYYVEEKGIPLNFAELRAAIPEEDITDANLRTAIEAFGKPSLGYLGERDGNG